MTKHILSTMSHNVAYTIYEMTGDLPVPKKKIKIFGGAGIPSETSGVGIVSKGLDGRPLWTPQGVVTQISDEDYELLREHKVFMKHHDAKYVQLINSDISHSSREMEKKTSNMKRDGFQLLTKETLPGAVKVAIGKVDGDEGRI